MRMILPEKLFYLLLTLAIVLSAILIYLLLVGFMAVCIKGIINLIGAVEKKNDVKRR